MQGFSAAYSKFPVVFPNQQSVDHALRIRWRENVKVNFDHTFRKITRPTYLHSFSTTRPNSTSLPHRTSQSSPPHTRPHPTTRPPKSTRPPRRRHQFISSVTQPFHFAVRHHFVLTLSLDHLCAAAVDSLPRSPYYSITKRGLDHRLVVLTIPILAHRKITRPLDFTG